MRGVSCCESSEVILYLDRDSGVKNCEVRGGGERRRLIESSGGRCKCAGQAMIY